MFAFHLCSFLEVPVQPSIFLATDKSKMCSVSTQYVLFLESPSFDVQLYGLD